MLLTVVMEDASLLAAFEVDGRTLLAKLTIV